MAFPDVLRSLRKSFSLTQDELADRLKITKQALSHYERGTRYPKRETLEAIADFFNVDMDYLTGRSSFTTSLVLSQAATPFPPEELHILDLFRNATPQARAAVLLTLESNQLVKKESEIS